MQMNMVKPWTCKWFQVTQCKHRPGRRQRHRRLLSLQPAAAVPTPPTPPPCPLPPAGWTIGLQITFWLSVCLAWAWGTLERSQAALYGARPPAVHHLHQRACPPLLPSHRRRRHVTLPTRRWPLPCCHACSSRRCGFRAVCGLGPAHDERGRLLHRRRVHVRQLKLLPHCPSAASSGRPRRRAAAPACRAPAHTSPSRQHLPCHLPTAATASSPSTASSWALSSTACWAWREWPARRARRRPPQRCPPGPRALSQRSLTPNHMHAHPAPLPCPPPMQRLRAHPRQARGSGPGVGAAHWRHMCVPCL